jgi:membrane protein
MAAALAYQGVFSLGPLLLIAIGIAGLVYGERAARGELLDRLEWLVGTKPAAALEEILGNIYTSGSHGLFAGFGFVFLLVGASWVFLELRETLNTIWKVPRGGAGRSRLAPFRGHLVAVVLILGAGLLLLGVLAAHVTVVTLTHWLAPSLTVSVLFHALHLLVSVLLIGLLFAMLYRFLPDTGARWRDVWGGAFAASLLYSLGNYALGLYLGLGFLTWYFGAASFVVVVLMWVYYSSVIFLLGAEFAYLAGTRSQPGSSTG